METKTDLLEELDGLAYDIKNGYQIETDKIYVIDEAKNVIIGQHERIKELESTSELQSLVDSMQLLIDQKDGEIARLKRDVEKLEYEKNVGWQT